MRTAKQRYRPDWTRYSSFPDKWWTRAGIPKTIAAIEIGLKATPNSHAHHVALAYIADLVRMLIDRVLAGDEDSGTMLGELVGIVLKNRAKLSSANSTFEKTLNTLEQSRPATKKNSALRSLIEGIIGAAIVSRPFFQYTGVIPESIANIDRKKLLSLPDFGPSKESADAWFDVVVYPTLQRMETELRDDPLIGQSKTAIHSGKFHVSSLKNTARNTLRRIAKLPVTQFFGLAALERRSVSYLRTWPRIGEAR
jgi:hypothetical protein